MKGWDRLLAFKQLFSDVESVVALASPEHPQRGETIPQCLFEVPAMVMIEHAHIKTFTNPNLGWQIILRVFCHMLTEHLHHPELWLYIADISAFIHGFSSFV